MTSTGYENTFASRQDSLVAMLARNWWALGLRGLLAIGFGLVALLWPGVTILSLVLIFAAYAFLDGVFAIASAVLAAESSRRWGWFVFEGLADIAVAAVAVAWPGLTAVTFVLMIAVWAIVTGVLELAVAFELPSGGGRWWLVLGGLASIVFGVLLIAAPIIGAVVLTWWLGAYAIVFGVALVVLALNLKGKLS